MKQHKKYSKATAFSVSFPKPMYRQSALLAAKWPDYWWADARHWLIDQIGEPLELGYTETSILDHQSWAIRYVVSCDHFDLKSLNIRETWIEVLFKKETDRMKFLLMWSNDTMVVSDQIVDIDMSK